MKLLMLCLDGVRADVALPEEVARNEAFARPDHASDPRFAASRDGSEAETEDGTGSVPTANARTLARLAEGGVVIPVWMTPPTDSGPGWTALLTGTGHERNNVWDNEFVGNRLAETPDVLTRIWAAAPRARTFVTGTWEPFTHADGPGPILQRRPAQEAEGQHLVYTPTDFSDGSDSADVQVTTQACRVLAHEGPDATVIHLDGVDHAGHSHGAADERYARAVERIDELVRHLVKAVAQRSELLGEDWLVAVTTDHGHTARGGHGRDQTEVRRSFLLLHRFAPDAPSRPELPDVPGLPAGESLPGEALRAEQALPLILAILGVQDGRVAEPEAYGVRRDMPSGGPGGDARFEW